MPSWWRAAHHLPPTRAIEHASGAVQQEDLLHASCRTWQPLQNVLACAQRRRRNIKIGNAPIRTVDRSTYWNTCLNKTSTVDTLCNAR